MRSAIVAVLLGACFITTASAQGLSGMVAPRGGATDSDATGSNGTGWLDGELRFGLGRNITALFEAAGGSYDSLTTLGGRGQAYWRDPSLGLVGILAETADRDGLMQWRTGVKGELYLGPVTLRGQAGYAFGDRRGGLEINDSTYGVLSAGFYGVSALGVNGGALLQDSRTTGFAGVEARIPGLPDFMTATLDGAAGANGYRQVLVGVRFYFGALSDAPLQQRHVGQTPGFPAFDLGATARPKPAVVSGPVAGAVSGPVSGAGSGAGSGGAPCVPTSPGLPCP
jgi:hypothetical protein